MRGAVGLAVGALLAGLVAPVLSAGAAETATGTVSGTVTSYAGAPVGDWNVRIYEHDVAGHDWVEVVGAQTGPDGRYEVAVEAGTYRVLVEQTAASLRGGPYNKTDPEQELAYEFWPDAAQITTAKDVRVAAGQTVRLDPVLEKGRTITADTTYQGAAAPYTLYRLKPVDSGFWFAPNMVENRGVETVTFHGLRPGGSYELEVFWTATGEEGAELRRELYSDALFDAQMAPVRIPPSGPDPRLTIFLGEPDPRVQNTTPPSISGTARVGDVVTADPGTWDTGGLTFSYQWSANLVPVEGATSRRLRIGRALAGKALTVEVTATAAALAPGTASSAPSAGVARRPYAGSVTVSGKPVVARRLQVVIVTRDPVAPTVRVRWYAGTKLVATGARLKLTRALVAKRIRAKVTFTHPYRTTVTRTTPYTARVRR